MAELTEKEQGAYDAYEDVYSFLHYEYKYGKKSKDQIIDDIKKYCFDHSMILNKK